MPQKSHWNLAGQLKCEETSLHLTQVRQWKKTQNTPKLISQHGEEGEEKKKNHPASDPALETINTTSVERPIQDQNGWDSVPMALGWNLKFPVNQRFLEPAQWHWCSYAFHCQEMQPWSWELRCSQSPDPGEYMYSHLGNFLFVWLKFVETDVHQMGVSGSINKLFFPAPPKQNFSLSESFQLTAQLSQHPAVLIRNEFLDFYPHGKICLQLWLVSAWKLSFAWSA